MDRKGTTELGKVVLVTGVAVIAIVLIVLAGSGFPSGGPTVVTSNGGAAMTEPTTPEAVDNITLGDLDAEFHDIDTGLNTL